MKKKKKRLKDNNIQIGFNTVIFEFSLRWSQDFRGSASQRIMYKSGAAPKTLYKGHLFIKSCENML